LIDIKRGSVRYGGENVADTIAVRTYPKASSEHNAQRASNGVASGNDGKIRNSVIAVPGMLRHARMSDLVKLRRDAS